MDCFSLNFIIKNIKENRFNLWNLTGILFKEIKFVFIYEVLYMLGLYSGSDCRDELLTSSKLMTWFVGEGALFRAVVLKPEYPYISKVDGGMALLHFSDSHSSVHIISKADVSANVLVKFPFPVSLPICLSFALKQKAHS